MAGLAEGNATICANMQQESRRRRPKLGQHFLADAGVRARLLQRLMIRSQDCWLEIGSGHGEMTLALAQQSTQVVAVEKDAALAHALREKLRGQSGCTVVEADIKRRSLGPILLELRDHPCSRSVTDHRDHAGVPAVVPIEELGNQEVVYGRVGCDLVE